MYINQERNRTNERNGLLILETGGLLSYTVRKTQKMTEILEADCSQK